MKLKINLITCTSLSISTSDYNLVDLLGSDNSQLSKLQDDAFLLFHKMTDLNSANFFAARNRKPKSGKLIRGQNKCALSTFHLQNK